MLQTEAVVKTKKVMSDGKVKTRIGGAPEWVQEFMQRIEDRDDVRDAVVKDEYRRTHLMTMTSLSELAESVGLLGGAVSRVDKKVEDLSKEMRTTRRDVANHGTRLATIEHQLHDVHEQINELNVKVETLEAELETLRKQED